MKLQEKLDLLMNLPLVEVIEIKKINLLLQKKQKFLMKKKNYLQMHLSPQLKFQIYQNKYY